MKTAGTTLTAHLSGRFGPGASFPVQLIGDMGPRQVMALATLDEQRPAYWASPSAVYAGHLPYVARARLADGAPGRHEAAGSTVGRLEPPTCITLLRDPVARTLSMIGHCRQAHPELRQAPAEAIYDDPFVFDRLIHNHQTRVLSMTAAEAEAPTGFDEMLIEQTPNLLPASAAPDRRQALAESARAGDKERFRAILAEHGIGPEGLLGLGGLASQALGYSQVAAPYLLADAALARPSAVDHARLQVAVANLDGCAVVGRTEDYDGFVAEVNRVLGLGLPVGGWARRGDLKDGPLPESFLRRIAEDNRFDLELVAAADELIAARRA